MIPWKWLKKLSVEHHNLSYKLSIIFSLFFLAPLAGFMYFAMKYNILDDRFVSLYFMAILVFSFSGYFMLRKMFDQITRISKDFTQAVAEEFSQGEMPQGGDELRGIVDSFQALEGRLRESFQNLEKKTSEISTLKELSDLCYMTFSTEDLLYITLERALKLANADIGSVMILEKPKRDYFIIEASIGSDYVKKGDRVTVEDSVAKYAVINKSPLLVEDIETDIRFGRKSRPQYSTKSFVCIPLKTINDVIGVLTMSRRKTEESFTQEDVDILIPLVSNASFTYDNLLLLRENERKGTQLKTMETLSSMINSSLRGSELLQAILHETKDLVSYDLAVIMTIDDDDHRYVRIADFQSLIPTTLNKGNSYLHEGTILGKIIRQQRSFLLHNNVGLAHPVEEDIFQKHIFRNILLTPLRVEGRVTGLLVLCNIEEEIAEDNMIESVADVLSRAIEKEKLLVAFARRNQEMETLRQIGSALAASTFDLEKILQHTMDMIQAIMDVEAGSLMLLNKNELDFRVSFNINKGISALKTHRLKLGHGIAGYSAARGEPIIVKNVKESKYFNPEFDRITGFETKSVLCVPLISQGRVLGVIEVLNKYQGEFNHDDLQLLQSIATTVSIAMENARLYGETLSMAESERAIRNMFQKFVPKEIVDKIIGHDTDKIVIDEFKILTLLDIDIRGYSSLSHKIGPQKTVAILNFFFSVMGEIVFKHHGIVDKYLGDGFLALFGAPVSSPMDADNAISAALDMRQAMEGVNHYIKGRFGASLTMGVSIHTGDVVVGNIGFDKKMDYTVIGDAVNFVFKLQPLCKSWPDGILISEKTFHAAQSPLNVEEVGAYEADDGAEKLKIYRVLDQERDNL